MRLLHDSATYTSPRVICLFIYPHAHCLSHCGYMRLFYLFYCIHFRPSFIRLLETYVARRYYYYSSDLQKLTRYGFEFELLSTYTLELRYKHTYIYVCICTKLLVPCIPQNQDIELHSLPKSLIRQPYVRTDVGYHYHAMERCDRTPPQ